MANRLRGHVRSAEDVEQVSSRCITDDIQPKVDELASLLGALNIHDQNKSEITDLPHTRRTTDRDKHMVEPTVMAESNEKGQDKFDVGRKDTVSGSPRPVTVSTGSRYDSRMKDEKDCVTSRVRTDEELNKLESSLQTGISVKDKMGCDVDSSDEDLKRLKLWGQSGINVKDNMGGKASANIKDVELERLKSSEPTDINVKDNTQDNRITSTSAEGTDKSKSMLVTDSKSKDEDYGIQGSSSQEADKDMMADETKWRIRFRVTGAWDIIEKELCSYLSQVMPDEVQIVQNDPPGGNEMTFVVKSESLEVNWQEVDQKLRSGYIQPTVGSVQLHPLTEFVSVIWLSDKCTFDFLELYLTTPKKTRLSPQSTITIVKFKPAVKKALVKVDEATAADIGHMCSLDHILGGQPLSINPWFGSVNDFERQHEDPSTISETYTNEENVMIEQNQEEDASPLSGVHVTESKRSISTSELPCYKLILKDYELIPDNVLIDIDNLSVLIFGTSSEVLTARYKLQNVIQHIKGLSQKHYLSASLENVIKNAGGELFLTRALEGEDIKAVVRLGSHFLEIFVACDSTEAEMAMSHILQRLLIKDSFSLLHLSPELKAQIQQICHSNNVAVEFDSRKGGVDVKLEGFRHAVQATVADICEKMGDRYETNNTIDKVTGAVLFTEDNNSASYSGQARTYSNIVQNRHSYGKNQRPQNQSMNSRSQSQRKDFLNKYQKPLKKSHSYEDSTGMSKNLSYQTQSLDSSQRHRTQYQAPMNQSQNEPASRSKNTRPASQSSYTKDVDVYRHEGHRSRASKEKQGTEITSVTIEHSLSCSELRYIQKYIQGPSQKQLKDMGGQLNVDMQKKILEAKCPNSQELQHISDEIMKVVRGLHTACHRIDMPGIYKFLTGTAEGKQKIEELEERYNCLIDIDKLRISQLAGISTDPPVRETPAVKQRSSVQKLEQGEKSKQKTLRNRLKKIIKSLHSGKKRHPSQEEEYEFGDLKVIIKEGDITKSGAHILVNVVTPTLSNTGLTKVFCDKGGRRLYEAIRRQSSSTPGDVFATKAHDIIDSSFIYHAVLPSSRGPGQNEVIRAVITQVLFTANNFQSPSVAFPALGCGGSKYDPEEVAEEFINCLSDFVTAHDAGGLFIQVVTLCIFKRETFHKFKECFDAAAGAAQPSDLEDDVTSESPGGGSNFGSDEITETRSSEGAMCVITGLDEKELKNVRKRLDEVAREYE